ncbi:hypothetical protein SAMN05428970_0368 [Agromyces sp. CF514]|uniref:hypothetical protein n=1 Tax=Agromyces sp. CF514 TaxID=1881031 RepID=UPI0008F45292|nr:hypothetical protein [Agromyces sp. CF514]SFR68219.1 hypothetical protein SAMN05428970_0368 [Agromyces sp. CF514]
MTAANHGGTVDLDETVVVGRRPGAEPDSRLVDETVVVDRRPRAEAERAEPGADAGVGGEVDDTIVVAPGGRAARADAGDTVVVERTVVRPIALPVGAPDEVMHEPARRERRPGAAPVPVEVLDSAAVGAGPGLLEHYAVRGGPVARPVPPMPFSAGGAAPTRDPAAALPSVARRSRRSALLVIIAFAGSCAVAAAGLVVVAVLAFAG